ncbi:hypothetical protein AMECASPLE_024839 [Ameca splendens]|uniref:Uncharacterized protein n=1 Tax=Ameca splendens TaxID=208324 RepID=A0ABV0YFW7_9TELE
MQCFMQRGATDMPPLGLGTAMEEIRAIDVPRAQGPQENHWRDYSNLPREEQGRVPGKPPSSHSAEAPGSCCDKPAVYARADPVMDPEIQDPGTYHFPSRCPTEPRGPGPSKQPPGVNQHTPAPSPGHREPQVHQRGEIPTTGR